MPTNPFEPPKEVNEPGKSLDWVWYAYAAFVSVAVVLILIPWIYGVFVIVNAFFGP